MTRMPTMIASLLAATTAAIAQDGSRYIDDRSDPAALVRSYYNAVNRREFARAWDYFGEQKPAADFAAFVAGFEATERVEVVTGPPSEEGAAGSVYFNLPVAIRAIATDGGQTVFAGCYVARAVNAQIQEPPFQPMVIESGRLSKAEEPLEDALPAQCGNAPAPDQPFDPVQEKAAAAFRATHSDECQTLAEDAEPDAALPTAWEIPFRYSWETEADPERKARLFRFTCYLAAYNSGEVYYLADDAGAVTQLAFAEPELDIRFADGDAREKLESMTVIGYTASGQLVNSDYNPETRTIESFSKWRGAGDASSIGRWMFRAGTFTLVHFEVDPTLDGEVEHQTVLDFETGP